MREVHVFLKCTSFFPLFALLDARSEESPRDANEKAPTGFSLDTCNKVRDTLLIRENSCCFRVEHTSPVSLSSRSHLTI